MAQRVHRIMPPPGYLGCRLAVDEGDGCYVNDRWQRDDFGALRSVIQENREAKSSPDSLNIRLVIVLHSPNALPETGLRMCLPEKSQGSVHIRRSAVRSLQSDWSSENREMRA
jgi:hypothetical protein